VKMVKLRQALEAAERPLRGRGAKPDT